MARKKPKTKRIYYGPPGHEKDLYWTVTVSPARWPVIINGDVVHALQATEGLTIGCALSNVAYDNANDFRHEVFLVAVQKSIALAVDRLKKDGSPAHAVIYAHNYGHITECNDDGTLKKMVQENPAIMQRDFTLRVPRKNKPSGRTSGGESRGGSRGTAFIPQGALARAIRAGRIPAHVAKQIANIAKKK